MRSVIPFPARAQRRCCQGCGERFPKDAPTFWRYCSRCYGYGMFRKAVEAFRGVRP